MEEDFSFMSPREKQLVQAGHGKRLANYLIDLFAFSILFSIVLVVWSSIEPERFSAAPQNTFQELFNNLLVSVLYSFYMGIIEAVFKGKSLGKLITGTRAVYRNGQPVSAKTAFYRGLIRVVPFCPFSGLGIPCHPWQDRWTQTIVIDEKRSAL